MKLRKNFRECPSCDHVKDHEEEDDYIWCKLEDKADVVEQLSHEEAWTEEFGKICPFFMCG